MIKYLENEEIREFSYNKAENVLSLIILKSLKLENLRS